LLLCERSQEWHPLLSCCGKRNQCESGQVSAQTSPMPEGQTLLTAAERRKKSRPWPQLPISHAFSLFSVAGGGGCSPWSGVVQSTCRELFAPVVTGLEQGQRRSVQRKRGATPRTRWSARRHAHCKKPRTDGLRAFKRRGPSTSAPSARPPALTPSRTRQRVS